MTDAEIKEDWNLNNISYCLKREYGPVTVKKSAKIEPKEKLRKSVGGPSVSTPRYF